MRWASFLAIALLGFALRMAKLGARPMHTDEAVNACLVGQMLTGKAFRYDPVDRHGPALSALALPLVRAQGAHSFAELTEMQLRLAPVLAGTVTLLLFGAAVELFGFTPCLLAAGLTAVAPLPVYYDRYFIHESVFAAASFALLVTGWRAWRRGGSAPHAVLSGASAALMLACKETAVLHFLVLGLAGLGVFLAEAHIHKKRRLKPPSRTVMLAAVTTFLMLSLACYTWLGREWQVLSALPHALPYSLARASGEGHQKPVWYYLQLLASGWSGAILCGLAVGGCLLAIFAIRRRADSPQLLLTIYASCLTSFYSLIPYKTPWLALNLWVPISLFCGLTTQTVYCKAISRSPRRYVIFWMALGGLMLMTMVAHDTRQWVFHLPADERNPYAYSHTSEDLLGLPAALDRLARERGISSPRIAVIAADPWPLPWYLRKYSQTGFWQPGQDVGPADFYITSPEAATRYEAQLHDLRPDFFGVRPGVLILLWSRDRD
jgi:uncharacterized protein (TIGR03663 family)